MLRVVLEKFKGKKIKRKNKIKFKLINYFYILL